MEVINRFLYKGDGTEFSKRKVRFQLNNLHGEFCVKDIRPFADLETRLDADLFRKMCESLGAVKLHEYGIYRNRYRLQLGYIEKKADY